MAKILNRYIGALLLFLFGLVEPLSSSDQFSSTNNAKKTVAWRDISNREQIVLKVKNLVSCQTTIDNVKIIIVSRFSHLQTSDFFVESLMSQLQALVEDGGHDLHIIVFQEGFFLYGLPLKIDAFNKFKHKLIDFSYRHQNAIICANFVTEMPGFDPRSDCTCNLIKQQQSIIQDSNKFDRFNKRMDPLARMFFTHETNKQNRAELGLDPKHNDLQEQESSIQLKSTDLISAGDQNLCFPQDYCLSPVIDPRSSVEAIVKNFSCFIYNGEQLTEYKKTTLMGEMPLSDLSKQLYDFGDGFDHPLSDFGRSFVKVFTTEICFDLALGTRQNNSWNNSLITDTSSSSNFLDLLLSSQFRNKKFETIHIIQSNAIFLNKHAECLPVNTLIIHTCSNIDECGLFWKKEDGSLLRIKVSVFSQKKINLAFQNSCSILCYKLV